jgi:hypothetical protein
MTILGTFSKMLDSMKLRRKWRGLIGTLKGQFHIAEFLGIVV